MSAIAEIQARALELSPEDREQLANNLLYSLHRADVNDIDQAWIELAEKRYAAFKEGKRQGIPRKRVFQEIREELGWSQN